MDVGGSYATYEVITVDLITKKVGETADVLYAAILPGVAASPNRIVACGGMYRQRVINNCQVYSPKTDECVFLYS